MLCIRTQYEEWRPLLSAITTGPSPSYNFAEETIVDSPNVTVSDVRADMEIDGCIIRYSTRRVQHNKLLDSSQAGPLMRHVENGLHDGPEHHADKKKR